MPPINGFEVNLPFQLLSHFYFWEAFTHGIHNLLLLFGLVILGGNLVCVYFLKVSVLYFWITFITTVQGFIQCVTKVTTHYHLRTLTIIRIEEVHQPSR